MQSPTIVKLGGSILTHKKSGRSQVRTREIERLVREIVCSGTQGLILLHGAGSFGHPLAHTYQLSGRPLSLEALVGAGRTLASLRVLSSVLIDILVTAEIPIVPLQTSALFEEHAGKLICKNIALVEDVLAASGVPVLGGDIVIADRKRIEIASADRLAVYFAQHFKSKHVLFATDVDGVYEQFPSKKGQNPLKTLERKDLRRAVARTSSTPATDITGAMGGKLKALMPLHNTSVTIFNGLTPGNLEKVLRGKHIGTRLEL